MQSTEPEIWKPVSGYECHYSVSTLGRVRRDSAAHGATPGRILKHVFDMHGYPTVCLSVGGRVRRFKVHRLVAETFLDDRSGGDLVCHNDGNPGNPVLSNLRWDTQSGNMRDTLIHGTHRSVGQTHCRRGHEFAEGTYRVWRGHRFCRECERIRYKERKIRALEASLVSLQAELRHMREDGA